MENLPSINNFGEQTIYAVKPPTEQEIKKSLDELRKYLKTIQNDQVFSNSVPYENKDYTRNALKRVIARKCIFRDCVFVKVAGTGSMWSESSFLGKCDFTESNFEFSDFIKSEFRGSDDNYIKIVGASFSSANFTEAILEKVKIEGCSFSQADFSNASIKNCDISSSTFENTLFHNAKLTNLSLSNLNIEFSDFQGAEFDNVTFSLMQFAYIFGLKPEEISQGNVKITVNEIGEDKILTNDELYKIVEHLIVYFKHTHNYFPLANLYLMHDREEEFKSIVPLALKTAILEKNYRMLKYLTKLIYLSNYYGINERKKLYELIEALQRDTSSSDAFAKAYLKHKAEIESFLIAKSNEELSLEFTIISGFDLKTIQDLFDYYKNADIALDWYNLDFSQNSPIHFRALLRKNRLEIELFLQFSGVVFAGIAAINSFHTNSLNDEQLNTAREAHQTVIKKIEVNNFMIRYNSKAILTYNQDNNTIYLNRNYQSILGVVR